jgi:NodT family efflux transporter outer membrane factor (OMF) lipoprotein
MPGAGNRQNKKIYNSNIMKLITLHKHTAQRTRISLIIFAVAIIIPAFSGCIAVGPDYIRIKPKASQEWHTQLQGGLTSGELNPETMAEWWTTLHDPELSRLMERAVKGNLDLKEARARIREARARRGIIKAALFPSIDAGASFVKYRSSENNGTGKENELYTTGFDAGWEIDIFGGVKRSVEAAQAELEAVQESLHDVLVSLLAEVARNYIEVRTYQARLTATETNIKAQKETFKLNRSRHKAGIIDELAVQQSLYNLERTRSQLPTLQTGLEEAKNRLAVLLGENPGAVHQELSERKPIPSLPVSVAVGIPAETMRHRPDIRRAERNLAAQTARIGVATADLYPKFRLPGFIGLESISSGSLLESASRTWSIGPSVSWNIFDAGAIRQNIKVQSALQEQALLQYGTAVLRAQEEVENVLVAYAKEQQRQESLIAGTAAAQRAYELSREQYKAGLVDFSDVLDAQRSLQTFQDELARTNGAVTYNLVRLYKSLGGGWKKWDTSINN